MKRVFSILLVLVMMFSLSSCDKNSGVELNIDDIHAICELATVKCYYNHVAQIDKKKDNIFQKDRKMWIEYEGEVDIGIDVAELGIDIKGNNVDLSIPKAKILTIKPNKDTLTDDSYFASKDGWLFKNKITIEEQEEAIKKGQSEMRKNVENNTLLFEKAENRAKELIENYIKKLGNLIGKEYSINWKN